MVQIRAQVLFAVGGVWAVLDACQAQCTTQWQPGQGVPGISTGSYVSGHLNCAARWDPDGPGSLAERVVIGGRFSWVGDTAARSIAMLDQGTGRWSPLGSGPADEVRAIATMPNGNLIALGSYSRNPARWDGSSWSYLPALPRHAQAVAVLPNNDVIAACQGFEEILPGWTNDFTDIYRWNGSTWSSVGPTLNTHVYSLTVMPNGDLIAISSAGGIARWDGSSWLSLGNGVGGVWRLAVAPNGDLIAAGAFTQVGGVPANHVAKWDGTAWSALGSGVPDFVSALCVMPNGDVWVGGVVGTTTQGYIRKWDGSTWSQSNTDIDGRVDLLLGMANQELLVMGAFHSVNNGPALGVAVWDGTGWRAIGPGLGTVVETMATLPNGDLVVTGGSNGRGSLRRWDGSSWRSFDRPTGTTLSLASSPSGDLIACGSFHLAPAILQGVVRWSGTTWQPVGSLPSVITRGVILDNGHIVATTGGYWVTPGPWLRLWDGVDWTVFGDPVVGTINSLLKLSNGDLIVAGSFSSVGGVQARSIARWDGVAWDAIGAGFDGRVHAMAELPNGNLAIGGRGSWFGLPDVQVWDGATWTAIGSPMSSLTPMSVYALLALPNGDLLAGGDFTSANGQAAPYLARWDGVGWSSPGGGMNAPVYSLGATPNGDVFAGGAFQLAGGVLSAFAARLVSTCPATATTIPTTCSGVSGPLVLHVESLPWIGAKYHSTVTGFGANSLGAVVMGLPSPAVPLSSLHPAGLANCDLLARGFSVRLLTPLGGGGSYEIAIPNDPALVRVRLNQQFLQAEFGTGGALALSSSNTAALTIGLF